MKIHRFVREQFLGGSPGEVFTLFTDISNLERITPPWVGFRIHEPRPEALFEGAVIEYSIRLAGIPVRWRTRITGWDPGRRFVDVQERGPYALWEHTHTFEEMPDGVLMRDEVRYALPLGPLGALAHVVAVRATLGRIFDYRYDVLARQFPVPGRAPTAPPRSR